MLIFWLIFYKMGIIFLSFIHTFVYIHGLQENVTEIDNV